MTKSSRSLMVARLARRGGTRLARGSVFVALALSGLAGFLCSASLLSWGWTSMPWRYGASTLVAYATFLLLVRLAIAMRRADGDSRIDVDLPDVSGAWSGRDGPTSLFQGGESGGAGAGASWGDGAADSAASAASDGGLDFDLEALPVVIVVGVAIAGLTAVGYVLYTAPVMMAEVALDVALVSALARRLPRTAARHWMRSAVRRTWMPAVAVLISLVLLGAAFGRLAPGATSVGEVFGSPRRR